MPNEYGGNENLEAVRFLQTMNSSIYGIHQGVLTIAEESTSWPKVSHPVHVTSAHTALFRNEAHCRDGDLARRMSKPRGNRQPSSPCDVIGKFEGLGGARRLDRMIRQTFLTAIVLTALSGAAAAQNYVTLGRLTCGSEGGTGLIVTSTKNLMCTFTPADGSSGGVYAGRITKIGLDIGSTGKTVMLDSNA